MDKTKIITAVIVAIGLFFLGWGVKIGLTNVADKDRYVVVKGAAEREVPADKVIWPIQVKETGDNLTDLYDAINAKQDKIKAFLVANGLQDSDITINAPIVADLYADRYGSLDRPYRYNVTLGMTVTSSQVNKVKEIISKQSQLLKEGIALVGDDYSSQVTYEDTKFNQLKPQLMTEAIGNAEATAKLFAENSHSDVSNIIRADQGQVTIEDRDSNTPYIKKIRVVTTIGYALK